MAALAFLLSSKRLGIGSPDEAASTVLSSGVAVGALAPAGRGRAALVTVRLTSTSDSPLRCLLGRSRRASTIRQGIAA